MTIREMQQRAWQVAEEKGLHDNLREVEPRHATMIRAALIHTEVSEALGELLAPLEAILKLLVLHRTVSAATQIVKKQAFPDAKEALGKELADILLRTGDLAEDLGIDLQRHVEEKQTINEGRPYRFGTPEEQSRVANEGE